MKPRLGGFAVAHAPSARRFRERDFARAWNCRRALRVFAVAFDARSQEAFKRALKVDDALTRSASDRDSRTPSLIGGAARLGFEQFPVGALRFEGDRRFDAQVASEVVFVVDFSVAQLGEHFVGQ